MKEPVPMKERALYFIDTGAGGTYAAAGRRWVGRGCVWRRGAVAGCFTTSIVIGTADGEKVSSGSVSGVATSGSTCMDLLLPSAVTSIRITPWSSSVFFWIALKSTAVSSWISMTARTVRWRSPIWNTLSASTRLPNAFSRISRSCFRLYARP